LIRGVPAQEGGGGAVSQIADRLKYRKISKVSVALEKCKQSAGCDANVRQLFALENAKMALDAAKLDACVSQIAFWPSAHGMCNWKFHKLIAAVNAMPLTSQVH